MQFIKDKSQNPKQLFRLFLLFSFVAFAVIIGTTAYGINSISKNANIREAEHDSVILSKILVQSEIVDIISILGSPKTQSISEKKKKNSKKPIVYSVQAGSFSLKSGALQKFNEITKILSKTSGSISIRVEKIGKFFTVRIGTFETQSTAKKFSQQYSSQLQNPFVIKSTIKKDRVIKSNFLPLEDDTLPSVSYDEIDLTKNALYKRLDAFIRTILPLTNVIKIKIFSPEGTVVYCTDASIVGIDDSNNARLLEALDGNINSIFKRKNEMEDVVGEKKTDIDVVETYLPIRNLHHEIIGSFEVYMDISRYRDDVNQRLIKSVTLVSFVLFLVLGALVMLMRSSTNELGSIQEKLLELSATDSLTGLFNRRYLFDKFDKEFKRLIHKGPGEEESFDSVGCIMCDIDHFKTFNDKHGHQVGDMILQRVSSRILETIRPYDIAGRYGGEEFLIILPNSSLHDTKKVAHRILEGIRSEKFETIEGSYKVTMSLGFSCLTDYDTAVDDVVKRADACLYKAKEEGRDRVCWNEALEV